MAMAEQMFGILLAAKADLLGDAGLAAEGRAEEPAVLELGDPVEGPDPPSGRAKGTTLIQMKIVSLRSTMQGFVGLWLSFCVKFIKTR